MPLYEYQCEACQHQFEQLILKQDVPVCPACGSGSVQRLVSMFAVNSADIRQSNIASARKAATNTRRDKAIADRELLHHEYEDHSG